MISTHLFLSFPVTHTSVSQLVQSVYDQEIIKIVIIVSLTLCTVCLVRMESSSNCPVSREAGTCSMPKFESTWGVSEI